jgi:VIT1/CCC1 family predicted Fe2+/Mn2+ transporter
MVMKTIENRIMRIEKRILRKISSLFIIGFGGTFLIFALFFFLRESLGWSNAAACFSIGITVFVIGLLLKAGESDG